MNNIPKLYELALQYRLNAYAPYSDFLVGAVLLCDDGKIYGGCNVENASYPCGTCAEAGAISAMAAQGGRKIREILIVADTSMIVPCGNCLQKIAEFGSAKTLIHSANLHGVQKTFTLSELIPTQFNAKDLKNAE